MKAFLPLAGARIFVAAVWPFLPPHSIYGHVTVVFAVVCCALSFIFLEKYTWWGTELAEHVYGFAIHANYVLSLQILVTSTTLPPCRNQSPMYDTIRLEMGNSSQRAFNLLRSRLRICPVHRVIHTGKVMKFCLDGQCLRTTQECLKSARLFREPINQLFRRLTVVSMSINHPLLHIYLYLNHATLFDHHNTQPSLCRRCGMIGLPVGGHYSAILEKNRSKIFRVGTYMRIRVEG